MVKRMKSKDVVMIVAIGIVAVMFGCGEMHIDYVRVYQ